MRWKLIHAKQTLFPQQRVRCERNTKSTPRFWTQFVRK
jgi:hypothetical protein